MLRFSIERYRGRGVLEVHHDVRWKLTKRVDGIGIAFSHIKDEDGSFGVAYRDDVVVK